MSKIKTNPSAIKGYIAAVKKSDLPDDNKDGIIRVLQQYSYNKQEGILSDGVICQMIFDMEMELMYGTEKLSREHIAANLHKIIRNIDKRKYWNGIDFESIKD